MRVRYITEAPQKENIYGVKVGDVFMSEWGYEQTNVCFYQVRKLIGEQSVMVDEVSLPEVSRDDGFLSANISYDIDVNTSYPRRWEPQVWDDGYVDKHKSEIVKRVKKLGDDIYIELSSYERAYLVSANHVDTFQSWWH